MTRRAPHDARSAARATRRTAFAAGSAGRPTGRDEMETTTTTTTMKRNQSLSSRRQRLPLETRAPRTRTDCARRPTPTARRARAVRPAETRRECSHTRWCHHSRYRCRLPVSCRAQTGAGQRQCRDARAQSTRWRRPMRREPTSAADASWTAPRSLSEERNQNKAMVQIIQRAKKSEQGKWEIIVLACRHWQMQMKQPVDACKTNQDHYWRQTSLCRGTVKGRKSNNDNALRIHTA